MKFVIAVIIFSVVILIHELGHFLLAKKNHIEVLEFSLGMGPRIISTVKGGTRYSVETVSSWRFLRHGRRGCGR